MPVNNTLSSELALRIGLAARALPDTDPKRLLNVLIDLLALPLNAKKLSTLKVSDLKKGADGELDDIAVQYLQEAANILRGETDISVEPEQLPELDSYAEGDMPGSIRVACASNHGAEIDGHFGSCSRFLVYQVSADEVRLIDIRRVGVPDEDDDKNVFRASLINDCQLLYTVSIGGPAAAKVVRAGLHPVKTPDGGESSAKMAELKSIIANNPPPWLAKVMGIEAEERFRFLAEGEG